MPPTISELSNDIREIKDDVRAIRNLLHGNGKSGIIERLAVLEAQNRLARYVITSIIATVTAIVATVISHGILLPGP